MRLQTYLNEEWVDNYNGQPNEVLINPSQKEINKLIPSGHSARFILDNVKKKIWVWDGYYMTHQLVYDRLWIMGKTISGEAWKSKGKWVMENSDELDYKEKDEVIEILKSYKWANKTINITQYIKELGNKNETPNLSK